LDWHLSLVFQFPTAVLFWGVYFWIFAPELRLVRTLDPMAAVQDAGTAQIIVIGNALALLLGLGLSFLPWWLLPDQHLAFYGGLGLMITGSLLRRYCFRLLGEYFTGLVIVRPEQPVIDQGLYGWVRHPSYTAGFLLFSGIGVALGSGLSIAVLFLIPCYTYSRRVAAEERALLTTLGAAYSAYMKRTKRFIPFIY